MYCLFYFFILSKRLNGINKSRYVKWRFVDVRYGSSDLFIIRNDGNQKINVIQKIPVVKAHTISSKTWILRARAEINCNFRSFFSSISHPVIAAIHEEYETKIPHLIFVRARCVQLRIRRQEAHLEGSWTGYRPVTPGNFTVFCTNDEMNQQKCRVYYTRERSLCQV